MDIRKTLKSYLESLPKKEHGESHFFTSPVETQPGRFSILCFENLDPKSHVKIVCSPIGEAVKVEFFPMPKLNEMSGYIPAPTNVKDIYSQYFQPLQVQTMMANDRMMVG